MLTRSLNGEVALSFNMLSKKMSIKGKVSKYNPLVEWARKPV